MSRVLGHKGVDAIGIIPSPDVQRYTLTVADKAIVIASDGVWDFLEDAEVVSIVKRFAPDGDAACKALVEVATQRWIEDDPTYRDDVSAIVIFTPLSDAALAGAGVTFTNDSQIAIADQKLEECRLAEMGSRGGSTSAAHSSLSHRHGVNVEMEPTKVGADARDAESEAARRRRIKASKEQMKRSVVSVYG